MTKPTGPKRGHQPRGLLVTDPGKFIVTVSTATALQGETVTITAQFATTSGSPVPQANLTVTWGKQGGAGGSFNNATSATNAVGVATVQFTVGTVVGTVYKITASASNGSAGAITGTSPSLTVALDTIPAAVSITPTAATLEIGGTTQFTAIVTNAIGVVLPNQLVAWGSSAEAVGTISAGGLLTALAAGSTAISATINGNQSDAATITVNNASVPASVVIAPPTLTIAGGTAQLTGTIKNAAGNVIPGLAPTGWSSSAPSVVTVSNTGLVTWVGAGTANITATYGSLAPSNTCVVTATTVVVQRLAAPTLLSVTPRNGLQMDLTWTNPDPFAQTQVWMNDTASDAGPFRLVATAVASATAITLVGGTISVTGAGTRWFYLVATRSTFTDSPQSAHASGAWIDTTVDTTPAFVVIAPTAFPLPVNGTAQISAAIENANGDIIPGLSPTGWSSSNTGVVTVNSTGVVTWVGPGTANVTAIYNALPPSNVCVITAAAIPTLVAPTWSGITPVAGFQMRLAWTNPDPAAATQVWMNATGTDTGSFSLVFTAPAGVSSVTLLGSDVGVSTAVTRWFYLIATRSGFTSSPQSTHQSGAWISGAVDNTPASVSIPAQLVVAASGTAQLTGTVKNAAGQVIPGLSPTAWASDAPSVVTVNSSGLVTWVAAGSATVTASYAGIPSNPCAVTALSLVVISTDHPNEPAGMSPVVPMLTGDIAPPPIWTDLEWVGAGIVSVVDPTSPIGSTNVCHINYFPGQGNGTAPGRAYTQATAILQDFQVPVRILYLDYFYKVSPNFPLSLNADKMMYGQINHANSFVIMMNASGDQGTEYTAPIHPRIILQNIKSANGNATISQVFDNFNVTMTRGLWFRVEAIGVGNTAGNADGSASMYINGSLAIHIPNVAWDVSGAAGLWDVVLWDPVYNLPVPADAVNAYHRLKNLYVSGRP